MNGALRVGGIVGGGYVGTSVLTVLETLGIPVFKVREVVVVRSGISVVERDDDEVVVRAGGVEVVVGLARSVVVGVVRVCCGAVVVGSVVSSVGVGSFCFSVVVAGAGLSVVLSSFCWAMTRIAKKAVRSRARFSESGGEPIAAAVSLEGDPEKRKGKEAIPRGPSGSVV
jgi:hypothetical protein